MKNVNARIAWGCVLLLFVALGLTAGEAPVADSYQLLRDTPSGPLKGKLHDNGDGTFSPVVYSGGGSSGGGAVTVADGADVALGTTTDAAVGDATGTLNGHARQIAKTLATGVTANAGTNLNTSLLALESGGNLASILTKLNGGLPAALTGGGGVKVGVVDALPAGGNTIGAVTQASGPWSQNITQLGGTSIDTNSGNKSAGTQRVVLATDQPQLTNALKVDGSAVTQPVSMTTWSVSSQTALTTTATVSGSSGSFGGYMFINLNSAPAYIQVFDTTGAVTLGSTTPTFVIPIPANSTAANGVGANVEFTRGITITNGIKIAATTTATGASTVGTGLTGFVLYK